MDGLIPHASVELAASVVLSDRSTRPLVLASQLLPYPLSHPTSNIRTRPVTLFAANAGDQVIPVHGTLLALIAVVAVAALPVIAIGHIPDAHTPVRVGE